MNAFDRDKSDCNNSGLNFVFAILIIILFGVILIKIIGI